MRILFVTQYYYPEQFQINEIAPELVKRGHQVTVLTGLPNYPSGIVDKEYRGRQRRDEIIDGVRVIRCFEIGRRKGKMNLASNYISYATSASLKARRIKEKYDVVICYQLSPVTMACPAIVYKKKYKCKSLLYCLDIWPESAQAHVSNDKGILYQWISLISKSIYNQFDRLLVTSQPFIDYMHEVNDIDLNKLSYLPQHADDSYLEMDLSAAEDDIADFMYAGNLGHGQVVENIILATAELKDLDNFKVHIVGGGTKADDLKELAQEHSVGDKIIFHGHRSRDQMPEMYKKADVLLITLRGNNYVGNTMPGKLQVYMTTGKPILGAINGAANQVITESGCGKSVAAGDYAGLARIMREYIENPGKFSDCGRKGGEYFRTNFTMDTFINGLEQALTDLVQ